MITALLGMDFERGLRRLAAVLEHGKVPATLTFIGFTQTPATAYLAITADCAIRDIGASMQDAYARLAASARHAGVNPAGPCFSIYHRWDLTRGEGRYSACMPVTSPPAALSDGLVAGQRPALRTYAVQLTGPFDYLADAWAAGFGRAKAGLFKQSKAHAPFEVYEKTPETHPGEASVTTLYFPAA
jgi:predicted transcriptional regulator YdeE